MGVMGVMGRRRRQRSMRSIGSWRDVTCWFDAATPASLVCVQTYMMRTWHHGFLGHLNTEPLSLVTTCSHQTNKPTNYHAQHTTQCTLLPATVHPSSIIHHGRAHRERSPHKQHCHCPSSTKLRLDARLRRAPVAEENKLGQSPPPEYN